MAFCRLELFMIIIYYKHNVLISKPIIFKVTKYSVRLKCKTRKTKLDKMFN